MVNFRVSEDIIREWCEDHMSTHTDFSGTRVETTHKCYSVEEFVKQLMTHIEDNQWKV